MGCLVPVYKIVLVREGSVPFGKSSHVRCPYDVVTLLRHHLGEPDRETFLVVMLTTKNRVIGLHTVSVGTLDSTLVHPREVYKAAILANAASIIVAHNHPSGDPEPSREDRDITTRLQQAGSILGIECLDHIILGEGDHFVSLKEHGSI